MIEPVFLAACVLNAVVKTLCCHTAILVQGVESFMARRIMPFTNM